MENKKEDNLGGAPAQGLSRFAVEIEQITLEKVVYGIYPSYGKDMEIGVPFWSKDERPRVIALVSGDRFDPGPEWKECRVPLLEYFLETPNGYPEEMMEGARREIFRILSEKQVNTELPGVNKLDRPLLRKADIPHDLRTCFACGRFVPMSRWQVDLSRKRLPVCDLCEENSDWLP